MNEMEMLAQIDKNLGSLVGDQDTLKARLDELTKANGALEARVLAADEKLKSQDTWLNEVDRKVSKARASTGGGDALLEALPDRLKRWIPRVANLAAGGATAGTMDGFGVPRLAAAARMAQADPVKYVAVAGWLQARIKASLALRAGQVMKAQEWNQEADKLAEAMGGFDNEAKAALQEDTNAEGGFLIPTVTESMIGWLMKEASVVRSAGPTMVQMTAKQHNLPTLANDFTAYWISEEGTITDAAPATPFGSGALVAKKSAGLVTVAVELIQDNIVNLMDFVTTHLVQQVGRLEDTQALEGDGTVFTGLFSAAGVTDASPSGAGALTAALLVKLKYGAEHQTTIDSGVMFMHPWAIRDAIQLTTGSAGSIWFPMVGSGVANPSNLLGPVFPTSVISRTRGGGTESTLYHGNPKGLVIGDRMGTQFEVDPYGKFDTAQVRLRLLRRTGVLVWVPGYFTKVGKIQLAA